MERIVEVCPNADWRGSALAKEPASAAEFDPANDNWDSQEYAQGVIKKNLASLALLSASTLLLLVFLLWRVFRCLCVACCCKSSCDEKRSKNSRVLWTKKAKLLMGLTGLTALVLIGLGSYGMYNLDVDVTKSGWELVEDVKDFLEDILDFGLVLVNDIQRVVDILDKMEEIFSEDIDISFIRSKMTCVKSMLMALPSPSRIQTDLQDLDSQMRVHLQEDTLFHRTSLVELEIDTLDVMDAPAATISTSESVVSDLSTKISAYNGALAALPATHSAAADAAVANLQTANSDLGAVSASITSMGSLRQGLQDFIDDVDGSKIDATQSSINAVGSRVATIGSDIASVSGALRSFSGAYENKYPCMVDVLAKMRSIDETILGLPTAVKSSVDFLSEASISMNVLFETSDPTFKSLADELEALSSVLALPDVTSTFSSQLSTAKANIESIQSAAVNFISDLDDLIGELNTIDTLKGSVDSQLSSYPSPGTSGAYSTLTAATDAIKPSVLSAKNVLSIIDSDYTDEFSAASSLDSSSVSMRGHAQGQLSALDIMDTAVADSTDLVSFSETLDEVIASIDNLGSNPEDVLDEPMSLVEDIDVLFSITVEEVREETLETHDKAKKSVQDAKDGLMEDIDKFVFDHKKPTVDGNHIAYVATLILYVLSVALAIMLMIFILFHCQFGVGMAIFWLLVVLVLYHLIASALGILIVTMNDGCHHFERLVLDEIDEGKPLVEYYLFESGNSLRQVLLDTDTADLNDIVNQALNAKNSVVNKIQQDFNPKGKLNRVLVDLSDVVDDLPGRVDELEAKIGFNAINPLYVSVKEYFCCNFPEVMYRILKDLTNTGILGLGLVVLGFASLYLVDKMPSQDCCGCTCHRKPPDGSYDRMKGDSVTNKTIEAQTFVGEPQNKDTIDTTIV